MEKFKMTDMGNVPRVLGKQITRDREKKTSTISEEEYTKSTFERFGMANCKPVGTPGFGSEFQLNNRQRRCSPRRRLRGTKPLQAR